MYNWRKMTSAQRSQEQLKRRMRDYPMHSPPHFIRSDRACYHLCAANFEHRPIIGAAPGRLASFSTSLCALCSDKDNFLHTWCVLPNHWHLLIQCDNFRKMLVAIGQLHGRSSRAWNLEDNRLGRQCWHCCSNRYIRNQNHFLASRNYIFMNPVKHGYVASWKDWPYSNLPEYLDSIGEETALQCLDDYPILDMGAKWDHD